MSQDYVPDTATSLHHIEERLETIEEALTTANLIAWATLIQSRVGHPLYDPLLRTIQRRLGPDLDTPP